MSLVLREAHLEDASAMAQVMVAAYQDHPIWKRMMHCVPVPDQIDFVEKTLRQRLGSSGTFSYTVIIDADFGRLTFEAMYARRIVAWTGLKLPSHEYISDESVERQTEITLPNGVDKTAAKDFFEALSPPLEKYGYNPKEHGGMWDFQSQEYDN
ncbi:hypothetical protein Asppvi_003659 [Aspergillus pseudoviridinutans]|uniref:Uncharacterized protein n=1 Tax=Aspergillus pseudoviridinutans TaxID=1517512 RepID=A0A9P3B8U6_9EURO|nr:uncharacterized protein Asppvi_003659 [Aspergillus pseudoviridinutans]GIJ84808.1 hypothetical protein Asppvi_003659 [Aspergillus pseudoviridinutans]